MKYKTKICRLCLKLIGASDTFEKLDIFRLGFLKTLPRHLNLNNATDYVICSECYVSSQRLFVFKSTCVDNNNYLKMLVDNVTNIPLIVGEVFANLPSLTNIKSNENVCRFCLKYFDIGLLTRISGLEKEEFLNVMIEKCLPETDLNMTEKDSLMCCICVELLQKLFNFTMRCLNTDNRIRSYTSAAGTTDSLDQIDLMDVLKFESKLIDLKPIGFEADESNSEFVVNKKQEVDASEFYVEMEESFEAHSAQEETQSSMDDIVEESRNPISDFTNTISEGVSKQLLMPEVSYVEENAHESNYQFVVNEEEQVGASAFHVEMEESLESNGAQEETISSVDDSIEVSLNPVSDFTKTIHEGVSKQLLMPEVASVEEKADDLEDMQEDALTVDLQSTEMRCESETHVVRNSLPILQCEDYSFNTTYKNNPRRHRSLRHKEQKLLICEWCSYQTTSKADIKSHMLKMHNMGTAKYEC